MMPGETQPAAPGPARCQGCASLQQNLNEYVEALITLKQKIINTDNLLTEYQKKCDELQFARRENSTLHHQVEQMLQKISPLQKCQEELGSLRAELEEKKSSLKLYQDTHQEYARVKEECLKSDAQKKKLEAKVKKLEEAAMRQTQDFKQLRNEKKILEKEFKKTQERLDEFSKHKNERELRHIGTQISSDSYGSIDKRKVKVLLKELWLCVNSAHRLPGEGSGHAPENPAKENAICGTLGEDGALRPAQGSPPRTWGVQACPTALSVEGEGPCASCESAEEEQSSEGGTHSPQCAAHEQRCSAPVEPQPGPMDDFASCGHSVDEDLQAAINFFKLPPPLLSPVPSPPLVPPRLSSSSSPLVPEAYFGEYTDSSDNDSAPCGSTAESASEDEAAESQDYFGLLGKSEGSRTWAVGKPKSQHAVRAPHRSSAHTVPPSRTEPFVAVPKEPFTTLSLARGGHWIASPRFVNERETLNVAASPVDVRKPGSCAQAGDTLHRPTTNLWVETPSVSLAQEKDIGPEESEPLSSPLVTRTLSELRGAQGKPPASNMERFPQPGFTTCSLTGVPSESDQVTGAGCFQRSRERAKERGAVRGSMLGPPEPDSPTPGAVTEAAGLDGKGGFSPSCPSASLCRNPQSSWLKCVGSAHTPGEVFPREVCHTEQLQMKTLDAFLLQAEPPEGSVQERNPGRSSHAWSSVLGAPGFNDEQSRKTESASALKGVTKTNSCPQSVFRKVTKDGRCESRDPVPGFSLRQSGFTAVTCSPTGSVTSGSASVKSSSWHHSDVLRRGGQESSIATSECEQKGRLQPGMAVLASEGGGLTAVPEHPGGSASRPLAFKASAALLPNQVSVITKQTRPEKAQGAILEPGRPRGNEPTLAVESCVSNTDGLSSGARRARDVQEAAVVESPSPEVSTSWRKLDFDFPGGSLPAESFDCSTDSRLSFSSEHSPTPSQDTDSEPVLQAELQKPPQSPRASKLGPGKVEGEERLAAQVTESCRDAGQAGTEGPMMTSDAPSSPQRAGEAGPESLAATHPAHSSALGSPDEETQDVPHSSLSAAAWCYTGPREQGGEDTEVEESKAFSCSEGEHEQEVEIAQQPAVGDSERRVGPSKAEAAEARPCADVGFLTSALKDFNISPFPDLDRLSTSEVVMFLQSCQLRDYSSGDSVSECSSRGTLSKEWKQSAALLGHLGKQLCEEEALGTSEEWVEAEDDDYSESLSQRAPCSLETLSKVLTKLGQELRAHHEDCGSEDADNPVVLKKRSSPAADGLETVPLEETPTPAPAPRTPELPQPAHGDGTGSAPPRGGSDPEHIQSSLKEESDVTKLSSSREGGLTEPGPPSALSPHREAPLRTEQSRSCVAESAAFQYRISTVTSEVINVRINKDQNVVIEKGDNWTIISGVAISPGMEQVVLCDTLGDGPTSQYQGTLDTGSSSLMSEEKPMEASYDGAPLPEPPRGSSLPGSQEDVSSSGQSTNFDKSRLRSRPVKPSIWVSSQIYDQIGEPESVVAFDHTYCNWKLESVGRSKNRSKISNKDQSPKPGKTWGLGRDDARQGEVPQLSGARESTKPLRTQAQPIVASADTSTPTDCSPDTLSKIRQEVGPPLPPLLAPLIATPPRSSRPMSPVTSSSSPSPASPPGHISPSGLSSWPDKAQQAASPGPSPAPSPSTAVAAGRIVSSPLQFCSATPKHALPVPGRLPPRAPGRAVGGGTQENSVRILDTMYPELSARARTLNLLKGSLQLSRGSCSDGKVLIGFKAITSTSTAFVKTRSGSGGDGSQERSRDVGAQQGMSAKRTLSVSMLRSAKRLRLDSESPEPESRAVPAGVHKNLPGTVPPAEAVTAQEEQSASPGGSPASPPPGDPKETVESPEEAIARALRKIAEAAFDLLPVIRSHVYVGNISKKPVMRDQEKEVVYEFSTAKKHLAECLLRSILSELKLQKTAEDHSYLHALCRVYVGICRQLGDLERARLFCYSVLKEDFPESEKLALFIANTWLDVFLSQSVISQAMQLVARHRARGEVQNCLRAFLCWEKSAPVDVGIMVSKLLLTIQLCPKTEFQSSEKFGEDLSDSIWEYVFAIDLLCCHQKWVWTHDHVISKELWPVMDKWIKFRKGHVNITYTPDVIVASILRLIGRLGQLGLKEGFPTAVRNISSVIGMFIQHARDEDIPWGIQLAAVYALCDLSPSNPAEISKILEAWRRETSNSVPCAIINCLEEVDSLSTGSSDP